MRRFTNIILIALALVLLLGYGISRANIGEPGSAEDPLVTKSYVDKVVAELKGSLGGSSPIGQQTGSFEVVNLNKGERLIAGKGTEIILRSGKAVVVDSELGGIADVTNGKDLKKDEIAPQNHLLIVPRDDGRGLIAQTDVVLVVRGSFKVTR
ncbi:MAG: hypothetical protein L5655_03945 [Thermosediminibacteraceae bacterium]|nr:hypothetical protein [Thermosediminibacteraceae bacterium]